MSFVQLCAHLWMRTFPVTLPLPY